MAIKTTFEKHKHELRLSRSEVGFVISTFLESIGGQNSILNPLGHVNALSVYDGDSEEFLYKLYFNLQEKGHSSACRLGCFGSKDICLISVTAQTMVEAIAQLSSQLATNLVGSSVYQGCPSIHCLDRGVMDYWILVLDPNI